MRGSPPFCVNLLAGGCSGGRMFGSVRISQKVQAAPRRRCRMLLSMAVVAGLSELTSATAHAADTVSFSTSAAGTTKSIATWGVEAVDGNGNNVRQSVASMGANNINL